MTKQANSRTEPDQCQGRTGAGNSYFRMCLCQVSSGPLLRFQLFVVSGPSPPPVIPVGAGSFARELRVRNRFGLSVWKEVCNRSVT